MRKSQWKPVPEDPQEKKEQHQTSDGEQERPAMTVGDLRKIFEPQKTKNDHGKAFEVRDRDGTIYKPHVLHSGVDQNRNILNQDILGNKIEKTPVKSEDPQEKNGEQGRPALTVGDLLKIYEPQKTNRPQTKNGTGYKSHVLHLGADQNRNVPNKDILGNKIEPQERNDVPKEMHGNSLGKTENLSTIVDDLQKKIAKSEQDKDKLKEKIDDLQKKLGELQKNLDKGVHNQEKYEQEKEELQHKLAHTLDRNEHLPATVDDICGKFDKYEEEKEELQHKFDDLQKKCEYTLGRREQLFSATVDNICEKLDKYEEEKEDLQHKFDDLQKKWAHNLDRMEKLSATVDDICEKLDKCEHDKEELQHKFGDLQKICVGNILEIREQLSATVGDIWGKFEEHQRKFEYSLSKKEQSSSILEKLQHQFEELQHQFDDHMKECEYCLDEKKRLSANIDDLWKITEELQHQFDKSKQEKERPQKIFDKKEQGKEDLPQKIEELQKKLDKYKQENEELQKKSEDLQKEIDRRKAQFKLGWRESTLYPDWRKEEFQAVNVILDEATAHPSLLLTEEGRGVTLQEIQQDLPSSTQRFVSVPCVLGQPQICSGRYYWEVEVGELHSWDLGVCRDNVSRKGTFQMSPQNGFWAIRLYQEDYWALTISETHLTLREKPLSVGIFLDYEAGDVSFYNMTDESHIFTFSKQTFYGVLRPLFRLWFPDSGPLTIVQVE